jgi:salicylate hydroxylase
MWQKVAMAERPFIVAGGGIGGLAAALSLAALGQVLLFERSAAFAEIGAGLQMAPNGVRALRAMGAWDAVEPLCVVPSEIHVRDGRSGALLQRLRLGRSFEERFGAPYRVCHRADLLAGLLSVARGRPNVSLTAGTEVAHAETGEPETAVLAGNGRHAARAVIAADGIRSGLRRLVCGPVAPVDRGHAIHRALIPIGEVPSEIAVDCVTLWLCRGGHVVHYPVSGWRWFNIVAATDAPGAGEGWSEPATGNDVLGRLTSVAAPLADLLSLPSTWLRWRGADLPDLPRWSNGSLVLLGDAAHATLPYLAQGAVMALEDAVVLARELAASPSPAEAFGRYEANRRPRTALVQRRSRRMGRAYHLAGPLALARNAVLRCSGDAAALRRMDWLYRWDEFS